MIEIQDIQESSKIKDVQAEVLTMACFYINPDLFLDYADKIKAKYDFSESTAKFLYQSLYEIYHEQSSNGEITEVKINLYMNQDEERKRKFKEVGGHDFLNKATNIADINDFEKYYENLKKHSLLREFEKKGFPAQKLYENKKFQKLSTEDILKTMEFQIHNIGTVIGGVEDSIILGKEMTKKVEKWKEKPDVGLTIPFDIINTLIRGLRDKKLNLIGMHSGCGKSRTTSKIACYIGIKLGIPVLVAANEQDEDEWDAMVLSCIINNPEFGFTPPHRVGIDGIDETQIVTGAYNKDEEEIIMEAAKYIEEKSKIHFLELSKFDEMTLRRQFKRHKIKGCKLIIYDTLKAPDHDWMSFVKTGDMLKEIAQELAISIWGTFQLTDDSLFNEVLNSQAIANGKHIKHITDGLMMARPLFREEYDKYEILNPNGWAGDEIIQLDPMDNYYVTYIDKNRGGKDKDKICLKVDKGKNLWVEMGYLILSNDEKEYKQIKKESKRLKQEREVRKLKQELGK